MKTGILVYSYTGNTQKWAKKQARALHADLIELHEQKRRSIPGAYICGSLAARRRKSAKIEPITADLAA